MPRKPRAEALRTVVESFQQTTIDLSTGAAVDYAIWAEARNALLSEPELTRTIPEWVVKNRWGGQFWQFIKSQSDTYAGRREFIWSTLAPLFDVIDKGATLPTARALEPLLDGCTSTAVAEAWTRIQARKDTDPEGAITASRSLLESTCKYVLDKLQVEYADEEDLPKLYGLAATSMKLGPQDHNEQVFKQILSGCFSVVNGMAAMRNALGDAHGKGKRTPRPTMRHATLAANLAGTIATFLIATFEERFKQSGGSPRVG
ncbi:MAG: abortive infection family protein [Gemmatimonadetes bacterium]|nr:abortive infection family protein [Gemmatimonadota bacterium]